VWDKVEEAQAKLSASARADVKAPQSASSLQLTLENEKVQEKAEAYVRRLSSAVEGKPDVLGYVLSVNGKFSGADVYSSRALFRKLWPRLLKSAALEAVAELPSYEKVAAVSVDSIRAAFADMEKGQESEREVTKRTRMIKREGERGIFFETRDVAQGGAWIHRNYLAK
jgi:hypothetical protein